MAAGLANVVVPSAELQQETFKIAAELSTRARSTITATKAMMLRLRDHRRPPAGSADDIIRECYGSRGIQRRRRRRSSTDAAELKLA